MRDLLPRNCSLERAVEVAQHLGVDVRKDKGLWVFAFRDDHDASRNWRVTHAASRKDASRAVLVELRKVAEARLAMDELLGRNG